MESEREQVPLKQFLKGSKDCHYGNGESTMAMDDNVTMIYSTGEQADEQSKPIGHQQMMIQFHQANHNGDLCSNLHAFSNVDLNK